eukprot:CAMPEP_0119310074 /NCGR_PEP_ID=MMETSP1333-20130426/17688_1 /TAXON_ID=418940 /ORGANISM="Scyphosphaera apsteinii, Strain RCC1455" /LENGTH=149 /DNA_ID=CAMNT_0007314191 /DNA_START=84 /DNA_END=533 /DNA_ORIENTATION=-
MPKKVQKTPDWLQSEQPQATQAQPQREERKRRTRTDDDDDDDGKSKGIRWGPIVLLLLLTMPAALPMLLDVVSKLQYMGVLKLPHLGGFFSSNKYRPCLQDFYADWAPEKLLQLDATLAKFEGKEKQLFAKLNKKYGKKVQTARCSGGK